MVRWQTYLRHGSINDGSVNTCHGKFAGNVAWSSTAGSVTPARG
jgi:hypothetical protein